MCARALLFFTLLSFICCLMVCQSSMALLKPHPAPLISNSWEAFVLPLHLALNTQSVCACVLLPCHCLLLPDRWWGSGKVSLLEGWQQPGGLWFSGSWLSVWQGVRSPGQGTAAK